jgi:hypothetical protein
MLAISVDTSSRTIARMSNRPEMLLHWNSFHSPAVRATMHQWVGRQSTLPPVPLAMTTFISRRRGRKGRKNCWFKLVMSNDRDRDRVDEGSLDRAGVVSSTWSFDDLQIDLHWDSFQRGTPAQ